MTYIFEENNIINKRYKILNYIDAGGMQEVYRAKDLILNKDVALKTPKNEHAQKRFNRSAVLSAKVNHPNVAKTLDYFVYNERAVLIEELIEGKSLDKIFRDNLLYFDHYLAAQFGHHLAKGVSASHHANVIHRDLKPGNIMVEIDENGIYSFKITDFGIAKLAEEELEEAHKDEASITGSQTMLGAIPYMAPEMLEGPKKADKPSDIWAMAAILYKALTGKHPYGTGLSAVPKIDAANLPDNPLGGFKSNAQFKILTSSIWEIISKCLIKNPIKRPSADELVNMFSKVCYGVFPRYEGNIKNYKSHTGDWGFISCRTHYEDVFFHKDSFYGEPEKIIVNCKVQFSKHSGGGADRAYPIIPIIKFL